MENEIKKINCPNCGGGSSLWGTKNAHDLFSCAACGLIFVHPLPDPRSIYNSDYFFGAKNGFGYVYYDKDKEPMIPTFNKYLDFCVKFGKSKGRLLDVGAATGFFLNMAKKRGYDVFGVEMSESAASLAREKGIDVKTGDLIEHNMPANSFDIITMFDVLEHMTEPFKELKEAKKILKKGGLLVINTPNGRSLLARTLKTKWHLVLPPEHLFYFSPDNLSLFLKSQGFDVLYNGSLGKQFTIQYIFKTLHKWQGFSVWNRLSNFFSRKFLSNLYVPINTHDNLFMIFKKIDD